MMNQGILTSFRKIVIITHKNLSLSVLQAVHEAPRDRRFGHFVCLDSESHSLNPFNLLISAFEFPSLGV